MMDEVKLSGGLTINLPATIPEGTTMAEQTIEEKAMEAATSQSSQNSSAQNNIMFFEKTQTELQMRNHQANLNAQQLNLQANLDALRINHQSSLDALEISRQQNIDALNNQMAQIQQVVIQMVEYGKITVLP